MCYDALNDKVVNSCEKHEKFQFSLLLPHHFNSQQYLPADLIGAEILSIGSSSILNKNSFGITYKNKHGVINSAIIEFDETGMWLSNKN